MSYHRPRRYVMHHRTRDGRRRMLGGLTWR